MALMQQETDLIATHVSALTTDQIIWNPSTDNSILATVCKSACSEHVREKENANPTAGNQQDLRTCCLTCTPIGGSKELAWTNNQWTLQTLWTKKRMEVQSDNPVTRLRTFNHQAKQGADNGYPTKVTDDGD